MRTLYLKDKNTFYAPAADECWVVLAKEIMASYSLKYEYQTPTTAFTQEEYNILNDRTYAPIRKSILRSIKNGPLRNVVDMKAVYAGLEKRRRENMKKLGVKWEDTWSVNIEKI